MDAGEELAEAVRLDHVVVGAELETHHPIDLLAAGGDDDDRHARALAQPPADLEAVDVRQAEVEQDEVGLGGVQGLLPGRCPLDLEAFSAQPLGERLGDRVFVFDDQDLHTPIVAPSEGAGIRAFPNLYQPLDEPFLLAVPALTGWGLPSSQSIERRPR